MITNIEEFCRLFYDTTFIPIHCYDIPSGSCCSFPALLGNQDIFGTSFPGFLNFSKSPDYIISPSFSYLGYMEVENSGCLILVGPVFSTPSSDFTIRNFMKEWAVSLEYKQDIAQFLISTPSVSFPRFLNTLAYLQLCLNDKKLDINQHFNLDDSNLIHTFSSLHSEQVYESKENRNYHNTYHFERKLMQYIQSGDVKKVESLLQNAVELSAGTMADNALRQEKNIFITSVALATRSAIEGGMDMEQAYQLADVYIQDCEHTQDISYISALEYSMIIDFTERVAKNKIPRGMSQEIFECIQFITQHINDPIQVSDVAEHIGKSRSYLCEKFKKELGFDVSRFIMRCKLEEAKSLLTYSNKALSEISNYLCFSSQSYFQNVFKKKYGLTPKQYRDQTRQLP
ncbi:MAG TPA: AraC family transcriptional regulator [Lachnospiraceae bacterium]|nr:AraC family transcriptional regulator [Lachnospiraceae bacterium]